MRFECVYGADLGRSSLPGAACRGESLGGGGGGGVEAVVFMLCR